MVDSKNRKEDDPDQDRMLAPGCSGVFIRQLTDFGLGGVSGVQRTYRANLALVHGVDSGGKLLSVSFRNPGPPASKRTNLSPCSAGHASFSER